MNAKRFLMRLLVAMMLLALLVATACSTKSNISDTDRQALMEQANAFMTEFQNGDYQAMYDMMTTDAQKDLDKAKELGGGFINVEDVITGVTSTIAKWDFDNAKIAPGKHSGQGQITITVEYLDGTSGTVRLGFNKLGGVWKVSSSSLEK
jgi:hypothetical protein